MKEYIPFKQRFKKCRENKTAYDVLISSTIPFLPHNQKQIDNAKEEHKVIICDKHKCQCSSGVCENESGGVDAINYIIDQEITWHTKNKEGNPKSEEYKQGFVDGLEHIKRLMERC